MVGAEQEALSEAHAPSVYGPGAELARSDAPVELDGPTFLKFGLPQAVRSGELVRRAEFRGVGLSFEPAAPLPLEVLYVPVGPGCVVPPYERQEVVRQVDG